MLLRCISLIILCLGLQACSHQTDEQSIRFGLNTGIITLDPRYITDAVSDRISRLIYQRMTEFDTEFRVVPGIATWEVLSRQHYRFHIKSGLKFHHGKPLLSEDIKASFESILDTDNASPHRAALAHIASIKVIDDRTIDFLLSRTDPLFPGRLNIGIMPKDLIDNNHAFNTAPVGSGPFQFQGDFDTTRISIMRTSDNQTIEFIMVKDPNMRILKLVRGEIDIIQNNLSPENITWLQQQQGIQLQRSTGNVFTYIGLNMKDNLLSNRNIRKAIAHAINRQDILKHLLPGLAREAESLLPANHWAGNAELKAHAYDPELARNLLAAEGLQSGEAKISFKTSSNAFRLRLITVLQQQLNDVGFNVEIQSYDWGTFYGDIKKGNFQMYSLSWVGLNLPDIFRYVLHSDSIPPVGANRGRYENAQVDSWLDQAETESDISRQQQLYFELQSFIHDDLPFIPLWYENNIVAYRNTIHGYTLNSNGHYDGLLSAEKK